MRFLIFLIIFICSFFQAFAEEHIIKIKITSYGDECVNKWCQVYVEIPAKLYMDKGWLRSDLKNLKFVEPNVDSGGFFPFSFFWGPSKKDLELAYWVPPKKDDNYRVDKLGLWLLVYDLPNNGSKIVDMIIGDELTYCNPGAPEEKKSYDRSSESCAESVFRFYANNLADYKFEKSPSNKKWKTPNAKFYAKKFTKLYTGELTDNNDTGNVFTYHIDEVHFFKAKGEYKSELVFYFLSQSDNATRLSNSPGYRLFIKKAQDYDKVSDARHYNRFHFKLQIQAKKSNSDWQTLAESDWYPYDNTRNVFDIKVSDKKISLFINGEHYAFQAVNGEVDEDGNVKRNDSVFFPLNFFSSPKHIGVDRRGWRICCGKDVDYIFLRTYFEDEPEVEVYGNTDLVVGQEEANKGENVIELAPDVQSISTSIVGNTLDKYIYATLDLAEKSDDPLVNQVVDNFVLKLRNRGDDTSTFTLSLTKVAQEPENWLVYWCEGENCKVISTRDKLTYTLDAHSEKDFVIKVIPSPSVLFNGGTLKLKVDAVSSEDGSWDNAQFVVSVRPKLGCYWKYSLPVEITWNPDYGYEILKDYQVLVEATGIDELINANPSGRDIIVTDSSGSKIPFWIKSLDVDEGKISLWAKVPFIPSGKTKIYLWWGNSNFRIPLSSKTATFDLYEDWSSYSLGCHVGCPDGTADCESDSDNSSCRSNIPDPHGWKNIPTPDDFYNWWVIRKSPGSKDSEGDKAVQADKGKNHRSSDTGPYLFNGSVSWDHYEVYYKMNAGPYCNYSGCANPWGNPQYNPVFVIDAGNMWGMEFYADKFIFRPYASGIDYVWQYQTFPKDILGESFPKRDKWYWVKVRVFKDRDTKESYLRVLIANHQPDDVDKDEDFKIVGEFKAPQVFSLPHGKIGFGGWNGGFYFDDIRVRKYVEGSDGKEPHCSISGSPKEQAIREKISLSEPQISPPYFNGRSAYILTETKPFSWLGDVKAFYADCYVSGDCQDGESQDKLGTISIFGKINDDTPKGLGYYLMKALPGELNRKNTYDENWMEHGRLIFTHLERSFHDRWGFDNFDLSNCESLKEYLGVNGTCRADDNYDDKVEKLIKFVRGFYVEDFPRSIGRSMDDVENYGNQDGKNSDDEQWKLGDILHSNPLIVGIPNMIYSDKSYWDFVDQHRDRPLVFYFMSNDGMLHAFEVAKFDSKAVVPRYKPLDKPVELWAYIPEAVLGDLKLNTTSNHNYLADGLLRAIDVKDANGNWRTVLVGIGGKGQSYAFAIDITDPEAPKFLWEINERNNPEVVDKLGTAISAPALGKLNGRWVAIFGTGYSKDFFANYTSKKAYLIIVDILTGQIINEVKVNDKIGNVLTDLVARRSFNGDIEKIYFGDYYGGIWAVPSLKDGGNWKLDEVSELSEDEMLFKPYYYDDVDSVFDVKRPITARPVISRDSDGSWWVFVGSGDYSEYDPSYPHQAFYGLKDLGLTYRDKDNCQPEDSYCGDLKNMTKSSETNPGKGSWIILLGYNDSNDKDSTGKLSRKNSNERVLRKAEVYGGYVFFTTFQPFDEPCGGGISRFYAVKFNTGEMGNQLFSSEVIGSNESGYVSLRSVELKGRGIPSQPMVYVGPSGKGRVVAAGLVNTSSGTLEKIDLNPASFIKNINILLWREVR